MELQCTFKFYMYIQYKVELYNAELYKKLYTLLLQNIWFSAATNGFPTNLFPEWKGEGRRGEERGGEGRRG